MDKKIFVLGLVIILVAVGLGVTQSSWWHDENSSLTMNDADSGKDVGGYVSSAYAISEGSYEGSFTPDPDMARDTDTYSFELDENEEVNIWITPKSTTAKFTFKGPFHDTPDELIEYGDIYEKSEGHISFDQPGDWSPGEYFMHISGAEGKYTFKIQIS